MSKYFSESEFKRCTPSCRMEQMDPAFLALLDRVREAAGIPLVLNSAYRSPAYEKKKGRTGTSSHCDGKAVDIRCNASTNRYKILKAAMECGIRRIGVGKTYIHLDSSETHAQDVIWHYYE
ncbi:MAG: DUF882 domain-containing protein [Bacteroidales bacterium]|nr:DUF882 domain-containing protein [Bacteroidales bacterium]